MNRQYYNQNLRAMPNYSPKKPESVKKTYLKDYIDEAYDFYAADYKTIKQKNIRIRAEDSLKYFYWLHKWYEGWSAKDIAFAMKQSVSNVQSKMRNTQGKVETFCKTKELPS